MVAPEQFGPDGRRVRCSKCNHAWHAKPLFIGKAPSQETIIYTELDRIETGTPNFKPGVNLPALLPINIPWYLYVMPMLLTAAIIFSCMVMFQDKMSFFGLVGTSDSLSVHDINIGYDRGEGAIVASYKIVNSSKEFVPVPLIRIRLLDEKHRTLKTHIAQNASTDLAPNQYITIRTNFADAPPNVEFIDITLGNRLDFILR